VAAWPGQRAWVDPIDLERTVSESISRRALMQRAALAAAAGVAPAAMGAVPDAAQAEARLEFAAAPHHVSPRAALRMLMEGNRRWVRGAARHPSQTIQRRRRLAKGQNPFAVIFSCIDSRVPPEIVFDRGLGDLFVTRTGAQTADGVALGSVGFGPDELGTPLIFVLGHQSCGAVIAAIESIRTNTPAPGHVQAVVDALRPAYAVAVHQSGDLVDNMVRAQTKLTVAQLKKEPGLAEKIRAGRLMIVGGRYSLTTGRVEIIA
jgi:carbonic anhydrase